MINVASLALGILFSLPFRSLEKTAGGSSHENMKIPLRSPATIIFMEEHGKVPRRKPSGFMPDLIKD